MNIPPTRIVLSGGGIRGLSYAGCFLELEQLGFLKRVKEFLCVSCGAMIAFGYIIGYSPQEIFLLATNLDFSLIQNLDPELAFNYLENYGIDDGSNLDKFLESLLKNKKFSKDLTFIQLYEKTNIYFRVFAVELNSCKLKEFSYKTTPNENVLFSLKASMCIPGYFIPLKQENVLYVDGGLINNYPINLVPILDLPYTLGFSFIDNNIEKNSIDSFIDFINQVFTCSSINRKKNIYSSNTVLIPCGHYPLWNFNASEEDRLYLIECGKKAVKDFYNTIKHNRPLRRNSVG